MLGKSIYKDFMYLILFESIKFESVTFLDVVQKCWIEIYSVYKLVPH